MRSRGTDDAVEALRLLRLVRLARELRLLWTLALIGLPVWLGVVVGGQAVLPNSSPGWNWLDDHASRGFVYLALIAVVAFLAQALVRFAGAAGGVAARLVPLAGARREPVEVADPEAPKVSLHKGSGSVLAGLVPRLRRRAFVSPGPVFLLAVTVLVIALFAAQLVPVWRANHGHGGPTFTIGSEYGITRRETVYHRYGSTYDYYVDTPLGEALAEDRKPHAGQRWTVLDNPTGRPEAYLIGGHDYLLVGAIVLAFGAFGAFLIVLIVNGVRRERRRRAKAGHVPLADTVRRLTAGERGSLQILAPERSGWFRSGGASMLMVGVVMAQAADGGTRLLARRRRTAVVAGSVAVVAVVAGGVVEFGPRHHAPASSRDVGTPYLAAVGWGTTVFADYEGGGAEAPLLADAVENTGRHRPTFARSWSVIVDADPGSNAASTSAFVDIEQLGDLAPSTAIDAVVALKHTDAGNRGAAATAVTGLPAGWRGVETGAAGGLPGELDLLGGAGGYLVWIDVEADPGRPVTPQLRTSARALAAAVAGYGIARFARDTAQR